MSCLRDAKASLGDSVEELSEAIALAEFCQMDVPADLDGFATHYLAELQRAMEAAEMLRDAMGGAFDD